MAVAFVKAAINNTSDASANNVSVNLGAANSAGHQIPGWVTWFNPTTGATSNLTSVTDNGTSGSSSYDIVDRVDVGGGLYAASFYARNSNSTTGNAIVKANFSDANPGFFRIAAGDYSGGDTTTGINAHAAQTQASPGTGTNAITSGTNATTVDGAAIVGFCANFTDTTHPVVGTGFTSRLAVDSPDNDAEVMEDLTQSTHGSVAATYTSGTGAGGATYVTFMLAIAPPSGAISLTGQTSTSSEGTVARAVTYGLTGQTATFTEGTISASSGGNVTLSLTGQTGTFTEGSLSPNIGYSLNDGVPLTGQTATFAEGAPTETLGYALTAQTGTLTQGTATNGVSYTLGAQTATLTEGTISASAGGNVTLSLTGQTGALTEGSLAPQMGLALTAQSATLTEGTLAPAASYGVGTLTGTFTEGTITPQTTGDVSIQLGGLSGVFAQGQILVSGGNANQFDTHDGFRRKSRFDDSAQTQVIRESQLRPPTKARAPKAEPPKAPEPVRDAPEDEEILAQLIATDDAAIASTIEEALALLRTLQ